MIISKINLFTDPIRSLNRHVQHRRRNKAILMGISLILFTLIGVTYLYRAKLVGDIIHLQTEENQLEIAIKRESGRQKELQSLLMRVRTLKGAMDNDVQYASKSAFLKDLFESFSITATFDSMSFSNPKDFTLRLAFPSQQEMLHFIKISENLEFKKMLQKYTVGSFSITVASDSASISNIDFSGTLL